MTDLLFQEKILLEGKRDDLFKGLHKAVEEGLSLDLVINDMLVKPMRRIGEKFRDGELWVPDVLIAARASIAGLNELRPYKKLTAIKPAGVVVLGTVEGDIHALGRQIVGLMLEVANYEIHDLGEDVPSSAFIDAAINKKADVIGISSFLISTADSVRTTIKEIRAAGLNKLKIIVGGYAMNEVIAKQIKADSFSPDASSAVQNLNTLLGI